MRSLIAQPISGGYTWTLTTRLGDMLNKAEDAYGQRDKSFTILGIEFEANAPQIWYPGDCRHIAIQLTPDTATDEIAGCYQLAHECIHLLSPLGHSRANTLEEGLATFFAGKYVEETFGTPMFATIKSYEAARQMVDELLTINTEAIKTLRSSEATISKITAQQMLDLYPSLPATTAYALEAPFGR
jgi:hypothetical protein